MKFYQPFFNNIFEKYIKGPEHPMKQRIIGFMHRTFNYRHIKSKAKFNFFMSLDLRDIIQRKIFFNGVWEPNLSLFIENELKVEDIFFDIGCNVGYFSLLAAKKKTNVFAFDPDPKNIQVLNHNCDINKFENITALNFGLGDKNENLQFFRSNIANNGQSGFINRNSTENFYIPVSTLDSLIYDQKIIPIPTFLKIDTEGWEEKILIGATHLLKTDPPRLIIFESEFLGNQSINNFNSIKLFLEHLNYTIIETLDDEYGTNHIAVFNARKDKVSIIIPSYNSSATLTETLQSIEIQDHDVEIIIVDNNSEDDTVKIIKKFMTVSKCDVKLLINENRNVSSSRNIGSQHATGNYILFLDSDDILKPCALITLLRHIANFDIVFGGWEDFDSKTHEILYVTSYNTSVKRNAFTEYFKFKPTISTALIKKEALVKWDEEMLIWEVTQFFFDMLVQGAKPIFIPNLVTAIRQQNNLERLSIKYNHFDPINCIEFLIKSKINLRNINQLTPSTEEVIDKEIISYFYKALKKEGRNEKLKSLFQHINMDLIPNYNNYKQLGIYHFILFFKGFSGLLYFSFLNKIAKRD